MPLFKIIETKSYTIGLWKLEEDELTLISLLTNFDVYKSSLDCIKSVSRRKEWLCSRLLLNTLCDNNKEIDYFESGSPFLKDNSFNISISHTKGYVSVIISKGYSVAIDIEYYSERVKKVTKRFIRDDETISDYNGDDVWSMLLHWSAKETAYKLLKEIEVDFLNHLQIIPFEIENNGKFYLNEYITKSRRQLEINYIIFDDFVMTWSYIK